MSEKEPFEKIIDDYYDRIPVPEDLFNKLSTSIDALQAAEAKKRHLRLSLIRWSCVAACFVGISLCGLQIYRQNTAPKDTYSVAQLDQAYLETQRVLRIVSESMNGGLAKAEQITTQTVNTSASIMNKITK